MDTISTTGTTSEERLRKQAYLTTIEHDLRTCQNPEIYTQLQQELSQLLRWFQDHPDKEEEIIRALNHLHYDEEMVLCHHSIVFIKGEPVLRQAYLREYRCLACGFTCITQRNMIYHQHTCAGYPVPPPDPADKVEEARYSADGLRLVSETPLVEDLVRKLAYWQTVYTVGPYRPGGLCLKLLRSYGKKLLYAVSNDPQASLQRGPGSYQVIDYPSYNENATARQREIIRKLILDSLFLLPDDALTSQEDQA